MFFMPIKKEKIQNKYLINKKRKKEMQDFLSFHFPKHETADGNVIIKTPNEITLKNKDGISFVKNYMQIVSLRPLSKMDELAKNIVWHKKNNYYITANTFCSEKTKLQDLFAFTNIVIDCDLHYSVCNIDEILKRVNRMIDFIVNVWNQSNMPKVNTIVFTGRGVQLWFATKSLTYKLRNVYSKVVDKICTELNKQMSKAPLLSDFTLDLAASKNAAGLFRMPGTFNTYANVWTEFYHLSDERLDLLLFHNTRCYKKRKKGEKKIPVKSIENGFIPVKLNRVHFLMDLQVVRKNNLMIGQENRDLLIFCLYSSCRYNNLLSHDESMEYVYQMNNNFIEPLPIHKIDEYLSTSIRKEGYLLSWKWLIERLCIKNEEIKAVLAMGHVRQEVKEKEIRKRKIITKTQKAEIIELNKKRWTQQKIADKVGVCVASVCTVLKKAGIESEVKKRQKRIWQAFEKGDSDKRIATLEKMTVRAIEKQRVKWEKAKEEKKKNYISPEFLKFIKEKKEGNLCFDLTEKEIHKAINRHMPIIKLQEFLYGLYFAGADQGELVNIAVDVLVNKHYNEFAAKTRINIETLRFNLNEFLYYKSNETILSIIRKTAQICKNKMYFLEKSCAIEEMKEYLSQTDTTGGVQMMIKRLNKWIEDTKYSIRLGQRSLEGCIYKAAKCMQARITGKRERRAKKRFEELNKPKAFQVSTT